MMKRKEMMMAANNYNYEQFDAPNTTFDCANS
jgi:hypothetical protein